MNPYALPLVIPVGSPHTPHDMNPFVRTPDQLRAVQHTMLEPGFDFACMNPFEDEWGEMIGYRGPFVFTWFTTDGWMRTRQFSAQGLVMHEWQLASHLSPDYRPDRERGLR